jgi:phosphatidylserine/phosphatidylglycerophosphate/cardiolipin synthase-like enzyme
MTPARRRTRSLTHRKNNNPIDSSEPRPAWRSTTLAEDTYALARPHAAAGTVPAASMLTHQNAVSLLIDTEAVYASQAEAIETAEHELLTMGFAWEDDSAGAQRVMQAIGALQSRQKARCTSGAAPYKPVHLRMVLDGSWVSTRAVALEKQIDALDPTYVKAELAYFQACLLGVQHAKSLIRDGYDAILTGANNEKHFDGPQGWHDGGVRVQGPLAATLRADWVDCRRRSKRVAGNQLPPIDLTAPFEPMPTHEPGKVTILFLSRQPASLPCWRPQQTPQRTGFLHFIDSAQRRLWFLSPALNVKEIEVHLCAALRRGVKVRLLLALNLDRFVQHHVRGGDNADRAHALYKALLEGGAEGAVGGNEAAANRLKIRWHAADGIHPAAEDGAGNSHAKAGLRDRTHLLTGSTNLDNQSRCSRETDVLIEDETIAQTWKHQVFKVRWKAAAPLLPEHLSNKASVQAYLSRRLKTHPSPSP